MDTKKQEIEGIKPSLNAPWLMGERILLQKKGLERLRFTVFDYWRVSFINHENRHRNTLRIEPGRYGSMWVHTEEGALDIDDYRDKLSRDACIERRIAFEISLKIYPYTYQHLVKRVVPAQWRMEDARNRILDWVDEDSANRSESNAPLEMQAERDAAARACDEMMPAYECVPDNVKEAIRSINEKPRGTPIEEIFEILNNIENNTG